MEFVRSAAGVSDLPDAGLPEFALVGRSNVGKSTLINALVRRPVARTSGTPGKTRLINLYRVTTPQAGHFYLVDLPGYGYARKEARAEFDRLAALYFARAGATRDVRSPESGVRSRATDTGRQTPDAGRRTPDSRGTPIGVLLALDARHPGMDSDLATLQWLRDRGFGSGPGPAGVQRVAPLLVVVTKFDKLSRNERANALVRFEESSGRPVLAVSAATGEGTEDLWKQMMSWVAWTASNRPRPRP